MTIPITQFDLFLNHNYILEMDRSMHYFMIMQKNKAIKKWNKGIRNLLLREVKVKMRAFSDCYFIKQSWLLFLVEDSLVEAYTS